MFKDKLRQLRFERNLTQSDVAKSIGVSSATIGNYEQGTREPKNNEMWKKLSDFFGVSVDYLMEKENSDTSYIVRNKGTSSSIKKDWTQQFKTDVPIIYNGVDITSLVYAKYDEVIPVTREQQYEYAEFTSRSGHVLYARRYLIETLNKLNTSSKGEISNNLSNIIEQIEDYIVYWYNKCWNNMNDMFPKASTVETLYDLLDKCLCVDMIAQREFSLTPIEGNFDWLREKLR